MGNILHLYSRTLISKLCANTSTCKHSCAGVKNRLMLNSAPLALVARPGLIPVVVSKWQY